MAGSITIVEFKPTIRFLLKFIGIYVIGSLLYGLFITSYYPGIDPITRMISANCAWSLNVLGAGVQTSTSSQDPTVTISHLNDGIISIYEGCNGVNVMIVFVAFVGAFGPAGRPLIWFTLTGLLVIFGANLLRLVLLYYVSLRFPEYVYPVHKFFFTAFIYLIVFLLWIWWVRGQSKR